MRLDSSSGQQHIFTSGRKSIAKSGTYTSLTFTVSARSVDNPNMELYGECFTVGEAGKHSLSIDRVKNK